jgi:hypothetical protein
MVKRPRWTKEEDDFLAEKRREGLTKPQIVEAYRARFPEIDRPDAGIRARAPSWNRAFGCAPDQLDDTNLVTHTTGSAVEDICNILAEFDKKDAIKILAAVQILWNDE